MRFDGIRPKVLLAVVLLAAFAVGLTFGLAACGGPSAPAQQKYEGFEPRGPSELDTFVEEALELAEQRKMADGGSGREELEEQEAKIFDEANAALENPQSASKPASEYYLQVLDTAPLSRGANVNLVLAYLAEEKNDEAFKQALACLQLFPNEMGCILNAQVAGTACHFAQIDIIDATHRVLEQASTSDGMLALDMIGSGSWEFDAAYKYNNVWNDIDTIMNKVAKEQITMAEAYEEMNAYCSELEAVSPDDKDVQYLRAFVDALAAQNGLQ